MIQHLTKLALGMLFGFGLSLSQMINPDKVLNFLDITGNWDAGLLFVMIGALSLSFFAFQRILKRSEPLWHDRFYLPSTTLKVDGKLVLGAIVFGIGWGISGYCPGTAVAAIANWTIEPWLMIAGIYLGFLVRIKAR